MANTDPKEATVKTTCDECKGAGQLSAFNGDWEARQAAGETDPCPYCSGTGQVDVAYTVTTHGHNGDFSFSEVWDVKPSLDSAKKLASKIMKVERHKNLHDGTPTVRWVEIEGPGIEESLGLEEQDGRLVWTGEAEPVNGAPKGAERSTMTTTTTDVPTAESLTEGLDGFEVVSPDKAPYARIRVDGRTLAYSSTRKDGVLLDFATKAIEEAKTTKKMQAELREAGHRTIMNVTAKNEKLARELLGRLAK